jgi:hypothetical protein
MIKLALIILWALLTIGYATGFLTWHMPIWAYTGLLMLNAFTSLLDEMLIKALKADAA